MICIRENSECTSRVSMYIEYRGRGMGSHDGRDENDNENQPEGKIPISFHFIRFPRKIANNRKTQKSLLFRNRDINHSDCLKINTWNRFPVKCAYIYCTIYDSRGSQGSLLPGANFNGTLNSSLEWFNNTDTLFSKISL